MSPQEDSALGVRPAKDAPTGHPCLWLAAGAVIICFAAVAGLGTLVNGGR